MSKHPFALIRENKIYRKGFLDFPEKEIGEVRESEETSIKYFEDRFRILQGKVNDLEKIIEESENKGSYLMKLIHLKDYLINFDGLGDFEDLYRRLEQKESYLNEIIQQNRIKNHEIKKTLLGEIKEVKDHYNLKEASGKINEIKHNWIRTGPVPEEFREEMEDEFRRHLDYFYKRREAFFEDRRKMAEHTISHYRSIVDESKKVAALPDIQESTKRLKKLQSDWKKLGWIPADAYKELIGEFKKVNDEVFNKYKKYKSRR